MSGEMIFISGSGREELTCAVHLVDGSILLLVKSDKEPGAVKLLSMKEAGFLPQNRTFPPREENVSITFQADAEITSDDGIINVSYLCPLLFSR